MVAFHELAWKSDSCHSQVVGMFLKHLMNLHYLPTVLHKLALLHLTLVLVGRGIIWSIFRMRKVIFREMHNLLKPTLLDIYKLMSCFRHCIPKANMLFILFAETLEMKRGAWEGSDGWCFGGWRGAEAPCHPAWPLWAWAKGVFHGCLQAWQSRCVTFQKKLEGLSNACCFRSPSREPGVLLSNIFQMYFSLAQVGRWWCSFPRLHPSWNLLILSVLPLSSRTQLCI